MLYSRTANVALAHYPKAAGSSLSIWFKSLYPDAVPSDPLDPHDPVARGLRRHGIVSARDRDPLRRLLPRTVRRRLASSARMPLVIGVLREPFDMLVSLYRFWNRRFSLKNYPLGTLPHAAGTGSFRDFLRRAVIGRELVTYEEFFDVGGPAWHRTRLLDFQALEPGLAVVCHELGLPPPASLPACNTAPSRHDNASYAAEAGDLVDAVRTRFRWYYRTAADVVVRPERALGGGWRMVPEPAPTVSARHPRAAGLVRGGDASTFLAEHALAAARRCETISAAVGLVRATGVDFVRNVVDAFPATGIGPDAELAWRQRACLLAQAFHGRLPAAGYDAVLRASFGRGSIGALHEAVVTTAEASAPQAAAELVTGAAGIPVVDVSATAQINLDGGMQRVVRSLAHHLPEVAPGTTFVRWDAGTRGFVPLPAEEAAAVRSPTPRMDSGRSPGLCRPTVFFWRQSLIIPEPLADAAYLDAIRLVAEATPARTTLVLADALPLRRTDLTFSLASAASLCSLGLLRHVDAISCVSRAVREHVESLLEIVPRRGPRPAVGVHHLGIDFPGATVAAARACDRPLVLCVGTIEPQQNQLRVLRAMVSVQAAGARFTGVFAGPAGWLDGPFRTELARAVAAGHSLELREPITEGEVHALYEKAAFTVCCSLDDGLGLPTIESLRHGRPCIVGDLGSVRELADLAGGCLLADPEDAAAIAAAIGRLISDTRLLERLAGEAAAASWPSGRDYAEELARFAQAPAKAALRRAA